ncbi:hypothetical protein Tco_0609855, partial [Tanacetum coccineum]
LETQDAKLVVSDSEDLSLLSLETKSLDTELGLLEGGMNVPIIGEGTTCIPTALTNLS